MKLCGYYRRSRASSYTESCRISDIERCYGKKLNTKSTIRHEDEKEQL